MIYSLQSLRVVFALCIFFHHLDLFEAGGSCGVSFFLVLSGFVLAAGYGERVIRSDFSWKGYMQKRMARLLPVHWLTLLLALWVHGVLRGEQFSAGPLIANVLLLQSWFPWYGYFFSGNAVSWYLSDLMFFYAVFPLLMRGWSRVRRRYWFWGSGGLLLMVLYGLFQARLPELYGNQLLYIHPLFRLLDFGLGVFTYRAYSRLRTCALTSAQSTCLEGAALLLTVGSCLLYPYVPQNATHALLFWLPSVCLILAFAIGEKNRGRISAFLCHQSWQKPAAWSFSFYMVHQLCIYALDALLPELSALARILLCFLCSALLAVLLYQYFERPVASCLRQRLQKASKK